MLRSYVIPCVGALASVLLGAVIWLITHPPQEPALRWDGRVFTTKQEFAEHLTSKGASYEIWLSRHPGAAPWERAAARPAPRQADAEPRPAAPREGRRTDDAWPAQVSAAALGVAVASCCVLLLLLRRLRRGPAVPRPSAVRRFVLAPARLARRLQAVVPSSAERLPAAPRPDRSVVPRLSRHRSITAGDAAFAFLVAVATGMFALYVALLVIS